LYEEKGNMLMRDIDMAMPVRPSLSNVSKRFYMSSYFLHQLAESSY